METVQIYFINKNLTVRAEKGSNLLQVEIHAGLQPDAPCGGKGVCKKCKVKVNGAEVLACEYTVEQDITVELPQEGHAEILVGGISQSVRADGANRYVLAYDIGTTTVVCYLLDGITGSLIAQSSMLNPQKQWGADVISRIQYVMTTHSTELRDTICSALGSLALDAAEKGSVDPKEITLACLVGNTAMHHLALGIDPTPMTTPPYMPSVFEALELPASELHLPIAPDAVLRVLPNIAGFVGADTVGCLVSTDFDSFKENNLLIDIGTNGEMVLGNGANRLACSTAAGPAFEGAKIEFGMRGADGAIDHAWIDNGALCFHVIGGGEPKGICGSGLLDLIAALLDLDVISASGRMSGSGRYYIGGDTVCLTQKDVREVQLAKAAIRAGIELMAEQLGIPVEEISNVYLAGAFGNYMNPTSACRIGMIPPVLEKKIKGIGNAAGEGAKLCALSRETFESSKHAARQSRFLELASLPEFQDRFIDLLSFSEDDDDE